MSLAETNALLILGLCVLSSSGWIIIGLCLLFLWCFFFTIDNWQGVWVFILQNHVVFTIWFNIIWALNKHFQCQILNINLLVYLINDFDWWSPENHKQSQYYIMIWVNSYLHILQWGKPVLCYQFVQCLINLIYFFSVREV